MTNNKYENIINRQIMRNLENIGHIVLGTV